MIGTVNTTKPAVAMGLIVAALAAFIVMACAADVAAAEKQGSNKSSATKTSAKQTDTARTGDTDSGQDDAKVDGKKAKVLSFGAMDVEGKMRTPQLLFFLGRVKAELDSSSHLRRSFIKELKATSKEKGL